MKLELDTALIRSSLGHGVAVMRQSWRRFWPLMLFMLGLAVLPASGGPNAWLWLSLLVSSLLTLMLKGALFRVGDPDTAADHPGLGRFGLQLGGVEGRLVWAGLGKWAFLGFLAFLLFFLIIVLASIIAYGRGHELTFANAASIQTELGSWGSLLVGFVSLVAGLWLFGLFVRLQLCAAASAYSEAPQVLATLHLTDRMVLTVLVVSSLVWLPFFAMMVVSMKLGVGLAATEPMVVLSLASSVLMIMVLTPLDIGIQAALYRSLKARHNPVEDPQDSGEKD